MNLITDKKTNKSMAIVAVALLVLPWVAKIVSVAGFPEYAELIKDAITIIATLGAGGGVVGLTAKAMKDEKVFTK